MPVLHAIGNTYLNKLISNFDANLKHWKQNSCCQLQKVNAKESHVNAS